MAKIEHFAIFAADAPALRDYYVSTLGLRLILTNEGPPPGFFLADDSGTALEIIGRPAGKTGAPQRWVCHVAFRVDDFDAAHAEIAARGAVFETDTFVHNDAFRTAFWNDPEGNRCQIIWRAIPLGG